MDMQALNKLVGHTMTVYKKQTHEMAKFHMKRAIKYVNKAKVAAKKGDNLECEYWIDFAMSCVSSARVYTA